MSKQITFPDGTPSGLQRILIASWNSKDRLRLFYGDPDTGLDDCQEWDVMGYVGVDRTGAPMLLKTTASSYGFPISVRRILRVMYTRSKRNAWLHPNYRLPLPTIQFRSVHARYLGTSEIVLVKFWEVSRDDRGDSEVLARFRLWVNALNYVAFLKGERCDYAHNAPEPLDTGPYMPDLWRFEIVTNPTLATNDTFAEYMDKLVHSS